MSSREKLNIRESHTVGQMKVQKRGARGLEPVKFDKITQRIESLCDGLKVDPSYIAQQTIKNLFDGISTEELDIISAKIAEGYKLVHPDYGILASRILVSNLHKTTPKRFSETMKLVAEKLPKIVSPTHGDFIAAYARELDNMIIDNNDYNFDYIGFKTLENSYLMKIPEIVTGPDGKPVYTDHEGKIVPTDTVYFTAANIAVVNNPLNVTVAGSESVTEISPSDSNQEVRVPAPIQNYPPIPVFTKKVYRIVDRPQYMFMRVAIAIYMPLRNSAPAPLGQGTLAEALSNIKNCYKALSQKLFIHATPTLFNSCTRKQQLLSCFLLGTGDSIEEINRNLTNASIISKWAGGIGIHMSNIRPRGSKIEGTNGESSGLPQQLKIYNEAALAWNQGGKRKGAFAIYLEPWQGDFLDVLKLKLQQGAETERARDLFYGGWIPDLFMKRINAGSFWSFFSESTAPGLSDVYDGMMVCVDCLYCMNKNYHALQVRGILPSKKMSTYVLPLLASMSPSDGQVNVATPTDHVHTFAPMDVFTQLYTRYESEGRAMKTMPARRVQEAIFEVQREAGTPYICYKDHVNRQTNQQNIGTIKSSNLCTEIQQYSDKDSYGCCTLASVNLRKFLTTKGSVRLDSAKTSTDGAPSELTIDHTALWEIVYMIARNLDIVVDRNDYPVPECEVNARAYRPIGIGVQGLADVFMKKRIPFLSAEAKKIDLEIFETIYHAALASSVDRARELGPYSAFSGSPASNGLLRFDLWKINQDRIDSPIRDEVILSGRYDWDALKARIKTHGLRNSLLVAPMPTVSTAQITGNNESFEPINANIYTKTTLAGKFTAANVDMVKHFMEIGKWNDTIKNRIAADDGSVMKIAEIPLNVREIYKTVWEVKQSDLIVRAALRSAFIDQSQSLNIYVVDNSNAVLRAVMNKGWQLGLMTGSYYIRTKPAAKALNTNLASTAAKVNNTDIVTDSATSQQNDNDNIDDNIDDNDGTNSTTGKKVRPVCEPDCESCAL